jgi:hypothetical protein
MKHIFKIAAALFTLAQIASSLPALGQLLPAGPASVGKPNADGPRITFSETVFDFGKIKAGEPVRHEFIATNTGNAVLDITMVQPGCPGCTTALPWDRQIQPGQTGKIPIQFNPLAFSGPVGKSVTVTCNDPAQPSHVLQFRANVWQPIDVQPSYLYFMPAEGEETNETKVVRIVSNLDEPLTLGQPQCDNPAFKLELKTLKAGKEFELHVSHGVVASNAAPQGLITISTTSSNAPAVRVTTRVMPQPAMAVSPLQIMLPAGSLSAGHRHTQMIRNNSSVPMKVTEAAVNAEGVTVQVNESQPGKLFLLTVNFPANFQVPAGEHLALTVKTSHPRRPIITVPVVQSTTPAPAVFRPPATAPAASK